MTSLPEPDPQQTTDHTLGAGKPAPEVTTDSSLAPSTQSPGGTLEAGGARPIPVVPGYEIIKVLGRGGMGVVYAARHLALKRNVALKMVLAGGHASPHQLARFRIEAEAVARIQHPHIVQIHDIGEADGHPYCALEFVNGGTLAEKLAAALLPPLQSAELVELLARAMQAAHDRHVVHRDLKPANVLLTTDGTPKITDFGLARQLDADSRETQAGTVMGTPSYMAPEQASGLAHEAGPAVDVYALGAILYECLTGRPPFQGRTVVETLDQVRTQEPEPPSRLRANIPRDLETICLKALAKNPARRYASAGALADDLRRVLNDEPILARRVGASERLWRHVRRNPALVGLSAVVLVLGVVVAVVLANRPQPQSEPAPVAVPAPLPPPPPVAAVDTSAEDLLATIAELDHIDPNWRLEQIEAQRPTYPDDDNSATVISTFRKQIAAATGRPRSEGQWASDELNRRCTAILHSPRLVVSEDDLQLMRRELRPLAPMLTTARTLADRPRGRFPTAIKRDVVSTLLPDHTAGRHLTYLLWCDVLVRLAEQDAAGATRSVLAMMHLARASEGEPLPIAQFMHMAHVRIALRALERFLAQAECDDDALAAFQRATREPDEPVLVTMARGDRGMHHYFLSSLAAGDLPEPFALEHLGLKDRARMPSSHDLRRLHIWLLRYGMDFVALARLPMHQQAPLLKRLEDMCHTAPLFGTRMVDVLLLDLFDDSPSDKSRLNCTSYAAAASLHAAELRTTAAALAVERYRLANGVWPRNLAAIVPEFLDEVPIDPYDGHPLRFHRTLDGVVIYSLGPNRRDDRGELTRASMTSPAGDIGFQLWDADKRRASSR